MDCSRFERRFDVRGATTGFSLTGDGPRASDDVTEGEKSLGGDDGAFRSGPSTLTPRSRPAVFSQRGMPGAKRESDGDVSPPAVKRSRGADPPRPDPPAAAHRDELGFEHDEAPSRALAASAGRCESAWSAFETTASCLGVDLEGRPEDVREFVRIKCVRRAPAPRAPELRTRRATARARRPPVARARFVSIPPAPRVALPHPPAMNPFPRIPAHVPRPHISPSPILARSGVGADSRARLWMAWSGAKEREAKAPRTYLDEVRLAFAAAADRAEEEDEADAAAEEESESSGASDPSDPLFSRAPASARRPPRAPSDMARHASQINLDVERTFPSHPDFRLPEKGAAGGNGRRLEPLRRVLMALAHAHPDVGYTQGMNFIAGWAMLALDASAEGGDGRRGRAPAPLHAVERSETSAFWLVSALLAGAFRGYFEPGLEALREDLDALDLAFCADHCAAWTRLAEHGCAVKFFCPRWLLCATVGAAPTAVALRVWDVFLVDADRDPRGVLLRVCAEALAMRQDAVRTAAGVGEAVEAVRAAPARVENVQGFLRRVRDAPRRDTRELAEAAERAKASEKKRREEHARRGEEEARKRRREAERASRVGPRAKATDAWRVVRERFAVGASAAHDAGNVAASDAGNAALSRPALTPFGNLLSMFQSATTPARAAAGVKPRRLVWGGQVGDDDDDDDDGGGGGGGGGGGEDASGATPDRGAARGS